MTKNFFLPSINLFLEVFFVCFFIRWQRRRVETECMMVSVVWFGAAVDLDVDDDVVDVVVENYLLLLRW